MTKLTHSLAVKIGAVMMWCLAMLGGVGGTLTLIVLEGMGFYGDASEIIWSFGYRVFSPDGLEFFSYRPSLNYPGMIYEPVYPQLYEFCYTFRYVLIAVAAISALIAIILLIFLMCSAGHQAEEKAPVRNSIDRIPLDIFVVIMGMLAYVLFWIMQDSFWAFGDIGSIIFAVIWILVFSLLLLSGLMTLATRFKTGTLWSNTIIYMVLRFVCKVIVAVWKGIVDIAGNIPILWKTILLLGVITVAELITIMSVWYTDELLVFWLLEKILFVPVILLSVIYMKRLQAAGKKLAEGELDHRVSTKGMYWDFRKHGENLNSISEGMAKAVNEKLKSERFKTELITNVSHDIKTPLTSIINYVDLIKKEEPENKTVAEYINVLDRQSSRLKKLIEDLVEASKASTGNIPVDMQMTSAGVVLTQAVGEYEDRMNQKQLELILIQPHEEVYIMADGRLLWRVFDNLLSNICKYAQGGTRVYLSLEGIGTNAVVTFRNISAYPLNMTSEELMERFTRADSSRHTDGSGLGLSIAKSLTDLQNGNMEIYTDGDLFKVILRFKKVAASSVLPDELK